MRWILLLVVLGAVASPIPVAAGGPNDLWSEPVAVKRGRETCVVYRAAIHQDTLWVLATHREPWHSYAMDNDIRVKRQLAGKKSLGVEAPTQIEVSGVKTRGAWRQTAPVDMSQPELRWYRWGFNGDALFAVKLDASSVGDSAKLRIHGQACNQSSCQRVDVQLAVHPTEVAPPADFRALSKVIAETDREN